MILDIEMIFHGKRSVIMLHFIHRSSGSPVVIISRENVTKKNERSYYNIAYSKKKQKPGSETIINLPRKGDWLPKPEPSIPVQ